MRKCRLPHCLDRPQYLNYTKLKPPVRFVLFLLVFFLVTTLHRGVDCCSCRGAGGEGRGSRHAIGWPGPASPADTANIFRLYVTAAAARAFLCVQDATSAVRDVITVVSYRLGPCLTLPEPASTMFSHFHLVAYLRRCLVPALKSFPCVLVYGFQYCDLL